MYASSSVFLLLAGSRPMAGAATSTASKNAPAVTDCQRCFIADSSRCDWWGFDQAVHHRTRMTRMKTDLRTSDRGRSTRPRVRGSAHANAPHTLLESGVRGALLASEIRGNDVTLAVWRSV